MTTRFSLPPPPPGHGPAGDADVVAFLQHSLIHPVDDKRAARDIELLAAAAKTTANVTAFTPRRERAFQRVAAAAAVVVVASAAGFGLAQFGGGSPDQANPDTLAFQSPQDSVNDASSVPSEIEAPTDAPAVTGSDDTPEQPADTPQTDPPTAPPTSTPSTPSTPSAPSTSAPSTPPTASSSTPEAGSDTSVVEPAPRQEAPVGDAGDTETIDMFASEENSTATSCDGAAADDVACDTTQEPATETTEPDPRDLLRERRFGAN